MRPRIQERGNAVVVAILGLLGVVVAAMISRGCFDHTGNVGSSSSEATSPASVQIPTPPTSYQLPAQIPAKEHALSVFNPCSEPLRIAVNHLDKTGDRRNNGLYEIQPGTIVEIPTLYSYVFLNGAPLYYYTRTVDGAPVEEGSRQEIVGGKKVGMTRAEKRLELGETSVLNLRCP